MSLPKAAAVRVNCEPVSCMPSPESPAKRIVTRSSCRSDGWGWRGGASAVTWSRSLGRDHPLVRSRRQVEELLGEGLGEVLEDIHGTDDADEDVVVVDQRHVPVAAGLHQLDGLPDRLVEVERERVIDHQGLD